MRPLFLALSAVGVGYRKQRNQKCSLFIGAAARQAWISNDRNIQSVGLQPFACLIATEFLRLAMKGPACRPAGAYFFGVM
jgi:hypothetical protein